MDCSSLAVSSGLLMFASLQGPLALCPWCSGGAELCCGRSGSCNAAELEWRELEGTGCSGQRGPHRVAILACVTSVFSSLCPLPGFCPQKQSTEHFKTGGGMRLASRHKSWITRWGGRMQQHFSALKSGLALPLLSTTPGGMGMLYEQF